MAIIRKTTFWFYVAMFYKMSMLPYLLSPFYLIYLLFTIDILSDGYSLSNVFWSLVGSIALFLFVAAVENNPRYIRKIMPASMIPNTQAEIDQHRLWMAFARYIYMIIAYFLLTKANMDFSSSRRVDQTVSVCNATVISAFMKLGWIVVLMIVFYWVCAFYVKSTLDVKRG